MARLEREQEELLAALCEASRRQPRGERTEFIAIRLMGGQIIRHPQLLARDFTDFHWGDLQTLVRYGLLHVLDQSRRSSFTFDVDPAGFEHWEAAQAAQGDATARIESELRRFLDTDAFRYRFSGAFEKWSQAEALLWSSDSADQFTTIGHLCREAMQAFAASFASGAGLEVKGDPAKTVARIRDGLDSLKPRLPDALVALFDALLACWGTVSDLVQRQEHGAQKEGEPVGWEDARLVVFHTAIVMFELARVLDRPN